MVSKLWAGLKFQTLKEDKQTHHLDNWNSLVTSNCNLRFSVKKSCFHSLTGTVGQLRKQSIK